MSTPEKSLDTQSEHIESFRFALRSLLMIANNVGYSLSGKIAIAKKAIEVNPLGVMNIIGEAMFAHNEQINNHDDEYFLETDLSIPAEFQTIFASIRDYLRKDTKVRQTVWKYIDDMYDAYLSYHT